MVVELVGYNDLTESKYGNACQYFEHLGDELKIKNFSFYREVFLILTEQNKALLTNADGTLTERGESIIEHTPFKRFGTPQELQDALIYLLSDASKFVDGGFTKFSGL